MSETAERRWRRIPPACSPVAPSSVLAAAARAAGGGDAGEAVEEVRAWLREAFDARLCLLTRSGTGALALALRAAARRTGSDRVALPAYTCFDVATAAAGAGTTADVYDLDPRTLSADPASLEAALRRGARTVVAAHLYGYPVDMAAVRSVAGEHGALVVEDAAQGAGGRLDGRPLGAHGDLAVLSFGRGKGRTAGAGGALLARTAEAAGLLEEEARTLATAARPRGGRELAVALGQWALGRPSLYRLPAAIPFLDLGATTYRAPTPPEPLSVAAAEILRRTRGEPDRAEAGRRRAHARRLREGLADAEGVELVEPVPGARPGELRFPVLLADRRGGRPDLGIMPGYPALLMDVPGFRPHLAPERPPVPGAVRLRDRLATLPTHGHLTPRDLEAVLRWTAARPAPPPRPAPAP